MRNKFYNSTITRPTDHHCYETGEGGVPLKIQDEFPSMEPQLYLNPMLRTPILYCAISSRDRGIQYSYHKSLHSIFSHAFIHFAPHSFH